MRSLFIGSTGGSSGRTLTTWLLAKKLKEQGLRVGFLKPYSFGPEDRVYSLEKAGDLDVVLLKEVLQLSEPLDLLCPVVLRKDAFSQLSPLQAQQLGEKIQAAYQEVSKSKDILLIMGGQEIFLGEGLATLSDSHLVKRFDALVILLDHYQQDHLTLFSLFSLNSFFEGRVKIALLNRVPPEKMEHLKTKLIPFIQEKGLKSVVAIPEDPILAAASVEAIGELLEAQIICGEEYGGNLIKGFTIGSKLLTGALSIFRQVYNRVILIRLPELNPTQEEIGGIILTGGKKPGELIRRVAQEASLPLLLTRLDTFQTVERLEKAKPKLRAKDLLKVIRFNELWEQGYPGGQWLEALL